MINKRKLQSLIYQLFCMFVGLAVISPIIYCVLVSFMQPSEILTKRSASDTGLHLSGKLYKGCDPDGYFPLYAQLLYCSLCIKRSPDRYLQLRGLFLRIF